MNKVKQVTLTDRIRAAFESFKAGKPKHSIQLGIDVKRCSECERPATPFFGCYEDEVFLPRINESKAEREEKERLQKQLAARHLLAELENAGAIRYDIKTSEPTEFMIQRVICVAKLDVVMPEKEEEQLNE